MYLDTPRQGFVLGQGADGAARQDDACEPSSQRIISIPLAGDGLKIVDTHSDPAFIGIQINAGPFAELVDQVKNDYHLLHLDGDESSVILVPLAGKV